MLQKVNGSFSLKSLQGRRQDQEKLRAVSSYKRRRAERSLKARAASGSGLGESRSRARARLAKCRDVKVRVPTGSKARQFHDNLELKKRDEGLGVALTLATRSTSVHPAIHRWKADDGAGVRIDRFRYWKIYWCC